MSLPKSFWKAYTAEPKYSSGSAVAPLWLHNIGHCPIPWFALKEPRQIGQRGAVRKGLLHKGDSLGAVTTAQSHTTSGWQGWADSTAWWQGFESHPGAEGREKTKGKDTTQVQGPVCTPTTQPKQVAKAKPKTEMEPPGQWTAAVDGGQSEATGFWHPPSLKATTHCNSLPQSLDPCVDCPVNTTAA